MVDMLKRIRFFIQNRFPLAYKMLCKLYFKLLQWKSREKTCRFGNLWSDSKVYIIRVRRPTLGLMGYYMAVLGHLRIAEEKKAIPVVDMMNYKNPYLSQELLGCRNSWEYYFTQTNQKITLEEAYQCKQVILSNLETPFEASPRVFYKNVYLNNSMDKYYTLVKKYMQYEDTTQEVLNMNYARILEPIINEGKKILGIVSRGTDILGFPGHSVQPTSEQLLKVVEVLMKQCVCEYVFVASDSDSSIAFFEKNLGKQKVLTNEAKRYDEFQNKKVNVLSEIHFERENDEYLKGLEYLTTIYLLSKCNALVGSIVGSTMGAICMNCGQYEHIEIIDMGTY